jgi:HlyD family secretion protein
VFRRNKAYPQVSALTESVYASALLKPKNEYQLFAAVSGILEKVYVEEGQLVDKGDTLFQITNSNPQLNAQNTPIGIDSGKRQSVWTG